MSKLIKKIEIIPNDQCNDFEKIIIFTDGSFEYNKKQSNIFEFKTIKDAVNFIFYIKQNWIE